MSVRKQTVLAFSLHLSLHTFRWTLWRLNYNGRRVCLRQVVRRIDVKFYLDVHQPVIKGFALRSSMDAILSHLVSGCMFVGLFSLSTFRGLELCGVGFWLTSPYVSKHFFVLCSAYRQLSQHLYHSVILRICALRWWRDTAELAKSRCRWTTLLSGPSIPHTTLPFQGAWQQKQLTLIAQSTVLSVFACWCIPHVPTCYLAAQKCKQENK